MHLHTEAHVSICMCKGCIHLCGCVWLVVCMLVHVWMCRGVPVVVFAHGSVRVEGWKGGSACACLCDDIGGCVRMGLIGLGGGNQ